VLDNKKNRSTLGAGKISIVVVVVIVLGLVLGGAGCTPPGPRALLEGRKLLEQGRLDEAIPRLQAAAELLPTNAVAWESLGVACHQQGQWDAALKAYQIALKLDDRMSALRFNLGCLYLDMNNVAGALDELRTFTVLQPGAVDGWSKLGTAQYRSRRLDDAEKSFRAALGLQARHPEALNGQGLIQVQRRRWPEALGYFNAALAAETNFAPALLNAAVVQHQYLNNRTGALQHYRQYVAMAPAGADEVRPIIAQLERELTPAAAPVTHPLPSAPAVPTAPGATLANPPKNAPAVATGPGPTPPRAATSAQPPAVSTERPPAESRARPATTNASPGASFAANPSGTAPASRNATRPFETTVVTRPPVASRSVEPTRSPAVTNLTPTPSTPSLAPGTAAVATASPGPARPPEGPLEVAKVRDDLVVRPPQDANTATAATPGSATAPSPRGVEATPPPLKKGFFSRLNPFSRPRETNEAGVATSAGTNGDATSRELLRPPGLPELAPPAAARYAYASPARPAEGNRSLAEQSFKRGVRWQKSGERAKAAAEYQAAIRADPAGFDAYYNLGLVALDSGDPRLSLWAYELALAIQPDSADARYNLSLALKAGGYPLDAAEQLQILVQRDPNDARAQLSLGNLYAQQLKQPRRARESYLRVLELNPRHPDAPAIRYWLAANP
jgi:tetratricopeptide (TPR) repeat protein